MGIADFIRKQKEIIRERNSPEYKEAELRLLQTKRKELQEKNQLDRDIRLEKEQIRNEKSASIRDSFIGRAAAKMKEARDQSNNPYSMRRGRSQGKTPMYAGKQNPFMRETRNPFQKSIENIKDPRGADLSGEPRGNPVILEVGSRKSNPWYNEGKKKKIQL